MKDTELSKLLNIPISTLMDWKKVGRKRKSLYDFLKSFSKEDMEKRLEAIKTLQGI